jgi:hypothetical protein
MRIHRILILSAGLVTACATGGNSEDTGGTDDVGSGDAGDVTVDTGCRADACLAACLADGATDGFCLGGECRCVGGADADADADAGPDAETDAGPDADAPIDVEEEVGPEDTGPDGFWVDDDGDTFAESDGDCDDDDARAHPGATEFVEGIDYDCDGLREFLATIVVTVDDEYDLCVNGRSIAVGAAGHSNAETYEVILESGDNVIGLHGYDTVGVTAAMAMHVRVNGMEIKSDGVLTDERDTTLFRYYPSEVEDPQATWCDIGFDDGGWGPALFNAEQDDGEWLADPIELRGRDVEWVWDGRPRDLRESWFRRRIRLPFDAPVHAAAGTDLCTPVGTPLNLAAVATNRIHNGVALAWTGSQYGVVWSEWYAPWRDGCDEIFLQRIGAGGVAVGTPTRLTNSIWFNTFPDVAWGAGVFAIVNEDSLNNRSGDQIYLVRAGADGAEVGSDVRVTTAGTYHGYPAVAFDGTNFGIVWEDDTDRGAGAFEIHFARYSAAGTPVGTHGRVSNTVGASRTPAIAWSGTQWGVAWEEVSDGNSEIHFARLAADGAVVPSVGGTRLTVDGAVSAAPAVAWSGTRWGIAWEDERDGNREIYFAPIAADGTPGAAVRITADQGVSSSPSLVHDGTAWTVVWRDDRDGNDEIYAARFGDDGARLADDSRLTVGDGRSWNPDLAWDGTGYAVAWEEETAPASSAYYFRPHFVRFACP